MSEGIKGYKVFNEDWTCRDKQYSCSGEFEEDGELILCEHGIHFCKKLMDCFQFYMLNPTNHVAEVIACGDVVGETEQYMSSKRCTNKLKIVKEIPFTEVLDILMKDYSDYYTSLMTNHSINIKNKIKNKIVKTLMNMKKYADDINKFIYLINQKFTDTITLDFEPRYDCVVFYRNTDNKKLPFEKNNLFKETISCMTFYFKVYSMDTVVQKYVDILAQKIYMCHEVSS